MKRAGGLYTHIAELKNMYLAFWKSRKGKRFNPEASLFSYNIEQNLNEICQELLDGGLQLGCYRHFIINDPKPRRICAPSFRERVIHHAIMNVCEPYFERVAVYDSYACRKGKGLKKAVERAKHYSKKYGYCLKTDIRKYFDSIDHEILKFLLQRLFKDKRLLSLFGRIIGSYEKSPRRGLPIGNLTSQYFANYYLNGLDHYVKETLRMPGYVRYMDDILIWDASKEGLKLCLEFIRRFLDEKLSLSLKDGVQIKPVSSGVSFLGYRIFPREIRLTGRSKKRFVRKYRLYESKFSNGEWGVQELVRHVEALVSFTLIADASGFRRKVIDEYGRYPNGL